MRICADSSEQIQFIKRSFGSITKISKHSIFDMKVLGPIMAIDKKF